MDMLSTKDWLAPVHSETRSHNYSRSTPLRLSLVGAEGLLDAAALNDLPSCSSGPTMQLNALKSLKQNVRIRLSRTLGHLPAGLAATSRATNGCVTRWATCFDLQDEFLGPA